MGSSRLPGKTLMDIEGKPTIARVVDRLRACETIDDIVLATTDSELDDVLAEWGVSAGVHVFRGSEEDVLKRVVEAQQSRDADVVVEITGDCPLLDPELIDLGVRTFQANDCDVVTNVRHLSFPQGADVQVFRLDALAKVADEVADPAVREHVSLYFYENPDLYRIVHLLAPRSMYHPELRLQLDYVEDLEFIRQIYQRLEPRFGPVFGVLEIEALLTEYPDLAEINAHCEEKSVR